MEDHFYCEVMLGRRANSSVTLPWHEENVVLGTQEFNWSLKLKVRFLTKSKIRFLNPKESENGFAFLYQTDQSKISRIMVRQSIPSKNPFSDSLGFKNPILDFLKETHPKFIT